MGTKPDTILFNLASAGSLSTMIILLGVWFAAPSAQARDDLSSPQYVACIDKSGGNTWDMVECNEVELKQQDDRLNKSFKALSAKLSPQRRKQLVEAQRAWISFRDADCGFLFRSRGGTSGSPGGQLLPVDRDNRESEGT